MKKWITIVVSAILVLLVASVLYPIVADTLAHNGSLSQMSSSFQKMDHPSGTTHVSSRAQVGLLAGNSNHCDYFVGEMREYKGDKERIVDWYKSIKTPGPDDQGYSVEVLFLDDEGSPVEQKLKTFPYDYCTIDSWSSGKDMKKGNFYVVYCFLVGFEDAGSDLRCH